MKRISLGNGALEAAQIGLGCMRITGLETKQAVRELIDTAMECGINFFDHADIYAEGEAERLFGEAVDPALRERMIIQTKCAIRPGGILEYCRLKGVTIQAWSPFQYGMFEGVFLGSEKYLELNRLH